MRDFSQRGETRAQFCERHGLTLSTFAWWCSHLRRESTARVVSNGTPSPASALFVELAPDVKSITAAAVNWDVELELGSGVVLRVRRSAC